ncbi:MAG: hypothetical protein U0V64_06950 [Cyclobacteriaceae bacterium]
MKPSDNKGFDPQTIQAFRRELAKAGANFQLQNDDERNPEYAHFRFAGRFEGKEVIFDAVMYTLRLDHESELFEIAEHRAAQHFPQYRKIQYEEDEEGNLKSLDSLEEEIGLFMAEVIQELEDEEAVKVKEHVDVDIHMDFGVGLDIGLHVQEVTDTVIRQFVEDYNAGTLKLDPALYSFQTAESE